MGGRADFSLWWLVSMLQLVNVISETFCAACECY